MLGQSGGRETKARVENNDLQMAGVVFFWKSYLFNGSTNLFSLFFYSLQLHPNYFSLAVIKIHRYNLDEKRSIQTINIIRPQNRLCIL